eukprot:TRINITY_DN13080_c0_g1_i2.p1 TRINITY_DN13080_c0_g1~~TRINITY_DN13080_c0_g1_i2.p1  ORF type:complete len:271 (-),score=58.39 TRINITY_DN13080_c0_g1_i2:150-962(-)
MAQPAPDIQHFTTLPKDFDFPQAGKRSGPAKLILIRHGESTWNKQNMYAGWTDIPLTEKGIQEALDGGRTIKDIPIDVVFVSNLVRSQLTAMLVLSVHSSQKTPVFYSLSHDQHPRYNGIFGSKTKDDTIPVFCSTLMNERHYGNLQGVPKDELKKLYTEQELSSWRYSYDNPPPDGESFEMVSRRTGQFIQEFVIPLVEKGLNVVLSGHGTANRTIMMHLEKRGPSEDLLHQTMETGVPHLFEYVGDGLFRRAEIPPPQNPHQQPSPHE